MAEFNGKKGHWATTESGSHIFIESDGSFDEAVEKAFGKENKSKYKEDTSSDGSGSNDYVEDDHDEEFRQIADKIDKLNLSDEKKKYYQRELEFADNGVSTTYDNIRQVLDDAENEAFDNDDDFENWKDDDSDVFYEKQKNGEIKESWGDSKYTDEKDLEDKAGKESLKHVKDKKEEKNSSAYEDYKSKLSQNQKGISEKEFNDLKENNYKQKVFDAYNGGETYKAFQLLKAARNKFKKEASLEDILDEFYNKK